MAAVPFDDAYVIRPGALRAAYLRMLAEEETADDTEPEDVVEETEEDDEGPYFRAALAGGQVFGYAPNPVPVDVDALIAAVENVYDHDDD